MARGRVMVAVALALAAGEAGAQSLERYEMRQNLNENRREMDRRMLERRLDADSRSRDLNRRIETEAQERRLSAPSISTRPVTRGIDR